MITEEKLVLPIGRTEFDEMSTKIIEMSGLPDNDSVRWALAAAIIHFPQEKPELTFGYFARVLRRGAANQVASAVFQELKLKQQLAEEAAKKLAEETPVATEGVQNEPQKG